MESDFKGTFQKRVLSWLLECFPMEVCRDGRERCHRFLEESLELVQALGCTRAEALQLVEYVYGRPVGEPEQELGGVMVTVAALCFPHQLNMVIAGEKELARVFTRIEQIRAKQAAKPKLSPLPVAAPGGLTVLTVTPAGLKWLGLHEPWRVTLQHEFTAAF